MVSETFLDLIYHSFFKVKIVTQVFLEELEAYLTIVKKYSLSNLKSVQSHPSLRYPRLRLLENENNNFSFLISTRWEFWFSRNLNVKLEQCSPYFVQKVSSFRHTSWAAQSEVRNTLHGRLFWILLTKYPLIILGDSHFALLLIGDMHFLFRFMVGLQPTLKGQLLMDSKKRLRKRIKRYNVKEKSKNKRKPSEKTKERMKVKKSLTKKTTYSKGY